MIFDLENNLALDESEYDDVKAYKIIKKFYDEAKTELDILNNRFHKYQNDIEMKQEEYNRLKKSEDESNDVFTPSPLRHSLSDELELINHQISSLKESNKHISESILNCTEKIAEYSFVLSVLENKNNNVSLSNIDKISEKIDFCIKLIEVDRERVKEELFHVKHLLQ